MLCDHKAVSMVWAERWRWGCSPGRGGNNTIGQRLPTNVHRRGRVIRYLRHSSSLLYYTKGVNLSIVEEASMSEPYLPLCASEADNLEVTQSNSNFPWKTGLFLPFSNQSNPINDSNNIKKLIFLWWKVRQAFFLLFSSFPPSYNPGRETTAILTLPKSNRRHQCDNINWWENILYLKLK